jgi:hypothetical protein
METKKDKITPISSIEHFCSTRIAVYSVLSLLVFGLIKVDMTLVKAMRQTYSQSFGLVDTYLREEPTRTPPNVGSEMRLTPISGR